MTQSKLNVDRGLADGLVRRRESTLVEIRPHFEPRHRNWESTQHQFGIDREILRNHDPIGCSALELADAMDSFLSWRPVRPR